MMREYQNLYESVQKLNESLPEKRRFIVIEEMLFKKLNGEDTVGLYYLLTRFENVLERYNEKNSLYTTTPYRDIHYEVYFALRTLLITFYAQMDNNS